MAGALRPYRFNGHDINDLTVYKARMVLDRGGIEAVGNLRMQAVDVDRHGSTPVAAFRQQLAGDIAIEVELVRNTQADIEQLKAWFNPELWKNEEAYLEATAEDASVRRILCAPISMDPTGPRLVNWHIVLHAAKRIWEQQTAPTPTTHAITNTGDTFDISNLGDALAYPTFTITPNTIKDAADDYITRRRIVLASRTELGPLDDPEGDGYPIELSGGVLSSPGDDVRLIVKGREYNRWISGNLLWANLQLQPRKKVTLAADFDNVSVEDITVEEALDEESWPSQGFILFNETDEVIQYNLTGLQSFSDITRGAVGTTATSHTAGEAIFFVEHGAWIDIVSGKSSPGAPPFPSNKQPAIDLSASTNAQHVWGEPHINLDSESRSRCWQRGLTDDGKSSQHIRSYNDSGEAIFEDLLPSSGKPLGNDLSMRFPVPIKADADSFQMDFDVGLTLLLQAFVEDIEGNESRLATEFFSDGTQTGSYDPGDILENVRLNGRLAAILGNLNLPPDTTVSAALVSIVGKSNVTDSFGDNATLDVTVDQATGPTFKLDADTAIHAFLLYYNGSATTYLIFDNPPTQLIGFGALPTTSSAIAFCLLPSGVLNVDPTFPAGDYCLLPIGSPGSIGVTSSRVEPFSYLAHHAIIPIEVVDSHGNKIFISDEAWWHDYSDQNKSPVFAVLSRTAEPQSDAPLETGNQIKLQNITAVLDETRAPYVATGDEEDLYLMQATITNTTTNQAFTLFHPMHLGQNIVIDCEARTITDGETGIEIPFAFTGAWPHLMPGTNTFSYDEVGVVSTTVSESHRDRWL